MDLSKFIENVSKVNWNVFSYPDYYLEHIKPEERIPHALISLASSVNVEPITWKPEHNTASPSLQAYVLNVIGNNHSGSYYPVIREALPFIIEVALDGNNAFCRNNAIHILDLLCFTFSPEDGDLFIKKFVETTIFEKKNNFTELAKTDNYNQSLIKEFVDCIIEVELENNKDKKDEVLTNIEKYSVEII